MMNLQENIQRIKEMMGLLTEEEQKSYESKPIVFIGTAGAGKSTTAKKVAESLGVEYIDVDERQGSEEYENLCKDEPGVEVSITRTDDGHQYGKSNDVYKKCVISKLLEKYGNSKVVLDIGAGTEESSDLLTYLPNLFVLGVPTNPDDDKPYLDFLKQSRIDRAKEMENQDLIDKETKMDTSDIQQSISNIRDYYRGKQFISVLNKKGKRKTPEELTHEIIFKLS
jgi:hypothetical protein